VLYNVNSLDIHQPDIAFLNEWFFNTMHHEFAHILHQTKAYPPDFNEISKADYQSSSWVNLSNQDALALGFVNNYASSETREDFVQTIAFYITKSDDEWQRRYAGNTKIEQKLSMVKDYLEGSWGINLEQLHQIVQRRQQEVAEGKLDLQSLK
jgi:substrate import-associated zinc metallohydrolase lipoprotein